MTDSKIIRKEINKLFKKYKIPKITLDNLLYIISDYSFEIIDFNADNLNSETLLQRLSLTETAKLQTAFTYKNNDLKFVFIRDNLSAEEKTYALAHELGHIVLGHLDKTDKGVEDEYEANEFAHYLLSPSVSMKNKNFLSLHKKLIIGLCIAVLIIAAAIPITSHFANESKAYGEYYITETGKKYHRKDCIFVKDKTNTHKLTKEEYESGEYEPCGTCLPDDNN